MTVLIGFSFADLTVLGADTRGTADQNRADVADHMQKIYRTGFGLMAGAGRSDIIEAVTGRFADYAPASSAETGELIREEVATFGLAEDDPALVRTCWLAAFATNTDSGPQARLAVINRGTNYEYGLYPHDDFLIIKPFGLADGLSRDLDREARRRFEQYIRNTPPERRLEPCVRMVAGLVKTLSNHSNAVSASWSVAYLDAPAKVVRVSSIAQNPDALEWR